ncbi:MAG: hypothetical protein WCK58_13070, partial [Chloroflexota bacterium]
VEGLPVATCATELALASPGAPAEPSLTAIVNATPTPAPTESVAPPTSAPTISPTASPAPTPAVAALTASTRTVSFDTASYCPKAVKQVTFRVTVTAAAGATAVSLRWRAPGAAAFATTPMARVSGSATKGTWSVTLDTAANGLTKAGTLGYYAEATDANGATRRIPASGSASLTVAVCSNIGPVITSLASSSGSSLSWNPLGAPSDTCQTATNITAVAKDVDGVASATLFFKRPGASTWASKAMDNTTLPGRWYANIDSLGDKVTIPTPPTGTLRWYIKAADAKGVASQSATKAITVTRCDTEALITHLQPLSANYACNTSAVISLTGIVIDADQAAGKRLKVVIKWSLRSGLPGVIASASGTVNATGGKGSYYLGTTTAGQFNGKTLAYAYLTMTVTTTDTYGGTSKATMTDYQMFCG